MIKLKDLLLEYRNRSHCWLAPNGKIIPVTQTHDDTARKLLGKPGGNYDPFEPLWKRGYQRVTFMYDGSLIANNEAMPPNATQMKVLKDIAIEGDHEKIEWDGGMNQRILWTSQDTLQEGIGNVQFMSPDGATEEGIEYYDELNRIEKESGINILSDKELNTLAIVDGKVVGAMYSGTSGDEFSFDIIVDKPYRRQGIAAKLTSIGLSEYQGLKDAGYKLKFDVVNPHMETFLLKKGFKVKKKVGSHTIMIRENVGSNEKYFVRFGDIPTGGKSTNWLANKKEKGVSVYEVQWSPKKNKWFIVLNSDEGMDTLYSLAGDFQRGKGRPIYLIKATPTKHYGADDEPLLNASGMEVVKQLKPSDLWNHELGDNWYVG